MDMAERGQIETSGLRGEFRRNEPMRRHVSWRAGGVADRTYAPADLDDLGVFLSRLPEHEPVLFVGLGSNLLVRDGGLRGTVVFTHRVLARFFLEESPGYAEIYAEAGVASPKIARFASVHNLEGAEFLAGIPGTVGGALAMNAGCYGSETWNAVARVRTIDRAGRLQIREPHEYTVGYRSVLPVQAHDEFFVAVWFRFARGNGGKARQKIKDLLSRRIATQPLAESNAGSVFRNPPGDYAARLIEASGLKGKRIGGAEVSTVHANFIVNKGGAKAHDIEELIVLVQETVKREADVMLEREVRIVGEA
ncbi:MAG: UDP-N-acetylmuramate dehydrogenase [Betaproteobacteria bacterium]|nr:UDP-N-acetylmuramate dehydrogenase [Betaproteobacteria bacterium]